MPTDIASTEGTNHGDLPLVVAGVSSRSTTGAGVGLVALLSAVSVVLAVFQGGSYGPATWLPLMAGVAALVLAVAITGPVVFSGRFQKVVLAIFALQAVWTAASVFWAGSQNSAWEETNRTLFYALVLALAFTAVRWAGGAALKAVAVLVAVVAGAVATVVLVTLAVTADPLSLFDSGRLNYPITYFNGLAALLMVGFWLALGMANGARCAPRPADAGLQPTDSSADSEAAQSRVAWRRSQSNGQRADRLPRWSQPLLLALAVVLAEVALLPQSRGALWTFFLVVPFFVILSPHRFRALADLVIVAAPVILFWDSLNAPYLAISNGTSFDSALTTQLTAVGYSVAMVVGAWAVTWLVERWIGSLRRKVAVWISVALAALTILGAAGGIVYADVHTGGIDEYLGDRWQELTDDGVGASQGATRFTGVGLNGRLRTWRVAVDAFSDNPALGLGAQNFEAYWYEHRPVAFTVRQPHSQPIQLLSELGLPGVILWLVFVIATLVYSASVRFRSASWTTRVLLAAIMTAVISWFIHSSADWLWQLAGVTLPVMMLFGALVGAVKRPSAPASTDAALPTDANAPARTDPAPQPQSRSSRAPLVRGLIALIAVAAIASAALPYVSLRYSALASGAPDLNQMDSRANIAAALDPTSIEPFAARAGAHLAAASAAPDASKRLQQLLLAATAWQQALTIEPGSWVCHLQAAQALLAARDAALIADITTAQVLYEQARIHLAEALRLNPLSPEVGALEAAR